MSRAGPLILGFLLAVAFVPGISGAATYPRWAVLALLPPILLLFRPSPRITPGHVLAIAFGLWSLASIAWAPIKPDAMQASCVWLFLGCCYWLGSTLKD